MTPCKSCPHKMKCKKAGKCLKKAKANGKSKKY